MCSTLTLTNHPPLCSIATASAEPNPEIDFPAKLQRSSLSTLKFHPDKPNDHACSDVGPNPVVSSSRRRGLISICIATLPCLLPLSHIMACLPAKATQPGTKEYLLIKDEVRKVLSKGKAAGVLRLVFHDAGTFELDDNTGGMNGSIVYELERHENAGLKKSVKVLQKAKTQIDAIQPGGPDPEGKLPEESLDASGLKKCFQRKGFSTQELVALSGAHTLGSKGFGSPTSFDNSYYKVLLEKPWTSSGGMSSMIGLPSDHALVEDDECLRWIKKYADNENMFFEDFKNAYVKLVNSGVRWNSL